MFSFSFTHVQTAVSAKRTKPIKKGNVKKKKAALHNDLWL
jgi:hypothetical protein